MKQSVLKYTLERRPWVSKEMETEIVDKAAQDS